MILRQLKSDALKWLLLIVLNGLALFPIFGAKKTTAAENEPAMPLRPDATQGSWLTRLKLGLAKTRAVLNTDVNDLFARHAKVDEALFEELETTLISADVGIRATTRLIADLRRAAKDKNIRRCSVAR